MARAASWWIVLFALWLALSDNHHLDELVAGAAVAVVAAVVTVLALERMSPGVRIPFAALLRLPRVTWQMTRDVGVLLGALWQTVVLRRPVRGRWVTAAIDDADTPGARGHRVATTVLASLAPNRVVGETAGGRLVVHELVRSDEPLDPLARGR